MAGKRLVLLLGGTAVKPAQHMHAGVGDNFILGRAICNDEQMQCHPLFMRDPNFGPAIPASERHAYALAAMQLNAESSCPFCFAQLIELGGMIEYPYLDPYVPQPGVD